MLQVQGKVKIRPKVKLYQSVNVSSNERYCLSSTKSALSIITMRFIVFVLLLEELCKQIVSLHMNCSIPLICKSKGNWLGFGVFYECRLFASTIVALLDWLTNRVNQYLPCLSSKFEMEHRQSIIFIVRLAPRWICYSFITQWNRLWINFQ